MEMQKQGQVDESFECIDRQTLEFIKNSHDGDIFKKYITSPSEVESILAKTKTTTYEISSLAPGKSLFLLLNAYTPDNEGLPKKYLHSFSEIEKIEYSIAGFNYVESNIKPLGIKRMGVIKSPGGAIGGQ